MKKGLIIGVLLLILNISLCYGAENLKSDYQKAIPEYHDFPLDNIHILRLQDAATSLGGNVSELRKTVEEMEARRSGEIAQLENSIKTFENKITAQVVAVQGAVENIETPAPEITVTEPEFPMYIGLLLMINIGLLAFIIIILFWLHMRKTPEKDELKDYIVKNMDKKSLHDIRIELASKGWKPSIIESTIKKIKEK